MFLFIFNNSTCTLSRDLTWLCVVIRIHRVLYHIDTSCTNCGVSRPTDGLCARCLDLPYCKVCKRHLQNNCFNQVQRKICQVYLQIVYYVTITCIFAYRYKLYYITIVTRSFVCVSQNCEKRRTKYRRTRTALNNVIAETSLPVTQFDTSFETLINSRQHAIDDIVQDALQQHGY